MGGITRNTSIMSHFLSTDALSFAYKAAHISLRN